MAIYHVDVATCSKASNPKASAYAKASYILREGQYAKRPDRPSVVFAGNMPSWVGDDPKTYFKEADKYERANGRLCKTVMGALPVELDAAERAVLANTFAKKIIGDEKLPYILAIHDDKANPHFHLMISERINDGIPRGPEQWFSRHDASRPQGTGARKSEALKSKEWLYDVRKTWAESINRELERKGICQRVSHLSLEARGIDREPNIHIGPNVLAMARRGVQVRKPIRQRSKDRSKDISRNIPKPFRRRNDDLELAL